VEKPSEPIHDYVTSNGNCDRSCNWFEMNKIHQANLAKETLSLMCPSCDDETFELSERLEILDDTQLSITYSETEIDRDDRPIPVILAEERQMKKILGDERAYLKQMPYPQQ